MRRDVDAKAVPQFLGALNWIFFHESDDFDSAFQSLIKALDTDLEYVRGHTRLLTRAIEWDTEKRDNSFLLRGNELREAEGWLVQGTEKEPKPTPLQTQYIIASREAETKLKEAEIRRQKKRVRELGIGFVVVFLLLLVVATLYWVSETRRKVALSRQLAAQANSHLDDHLDLALLISLEAYYVKDTFEAQSSLLTGLEYSPHITTFLRGHTEGVKSIAFSRDGNILASGSNDKTIILWDVKTRQPIGQPLTGHKASVLSVAFSPNGKMLASGSYSDLIFWNINPESWKARACDISNRNLTCEEWKQYIPDEKYHRTCPNLPGPEECREPTTFSSLRSVVWR